MPTDGLTPSDVETRARRIADEELFPAAVDVDRSGKVPLAQLQILADAGLYGLTSTEDRFGLGAPAPTVWAVIEAIASGCLTTAFVWTQHLGPSGAVSKLLGQSAAPQVAIDWAQRLASGESRAGVAFAHMLRPDPTLTTARPIADGWLLDGAAPWVTGWGHINLVHAAARHGDEIVWGLLDAVEGPTMRAETLDLAAVNSSATVTLHYKSAVIPAERVTSVEPFADWKARYALGLRTNGSLALGVARRCCLLLESPEFDAELEAARTRLDTAASGPDGTANLDAVAQARAGASAFAMRAAAALVASTGGRAVTLESHAQRLAREALFLLVQGQTPAIKQHLLSEFSR